MPVYNTVYNSEGPTTVMEGGNGPFNTAFPGYPESNMETMFGPVLLPKIYAKGLSALEIASSGSIVLSVNDFETLSISNDEASRTTQFASQSNYHLKFYPGDDDVSVQVGDHHWTSEADYQVLRTDQANGYKMDENFFLTGSSEFLGAMQLDSTLSVKNPVFMSDSISVNGTVDLIGRTLWGPAK